MAKIKKKAVVCGAGGFIGHHLVKRLKKDGYWVRGVDIKNPEFGSTDADEFLILDLRYKKNCFNAVRGIDEVYQLAADMGGMGFISASECEIVYNNTLINLNMIDVAAKEGIKRYFFSSSVCVYPNMKIDAPEKTEEEAYPAMPDNEYGWEKLYAERVALTYSRHYPIEVRTARFQNTYGPLGTWTGGREKAPAAICRKVAEAKNNGIVEIWGDGSAVRSYTYIDDLINGILLLMRSNMKEPVNIGCPQYVNVRELVETVAKVAKKKIKNKSIPGPVGVQSRNFSNAKIYSLGWKSRFNLEKGIKILYPWVEKQVKKTAKKSLPNCHRQN